ncbi:MAG: hypothetical protein BGP06_05200 [Rhizobiales bacterium 65-9]|nr:MAG: hypothetical protein BGP06_05200 [Rhizobiales bacterium 65-9]
MIHEASGSLPHAMRSKRDIGHLLEQVQKSKGRKSGAARAVISRQCRLIEFITEHIDGVDDSLIHSARRKRLARREIIKLRSLETFIRRPGGKITISGA